MPDAPRTLYSRADLLPLIEPQSIAVIGASARQNSFGARVLANLDAFAGRIHLVNARYTMLDGRKCHDSLAALPEVPDCGVIVVAREAVEGVLVQCAEAGVRAAIVFASGYGETGKPERAAEQARLAALARRKGIRLAGPNCIGIANIATGAGMTFSGMPAHRATAAHAVGVVSQSGALGFALAQAIERGAAVSHVLTSGNAVDVDTADYVAALAHEPRCRAIACLFEGMAEPRRLVEAARRSWEADKPLVVCKLATGAQGAAAALSHTGSLAGPDAVWRAALSDAGAVLVDDFDVLMETASFFAKAGAPKARGVAVAATSGGAGIMAADKAERHGVALPQPAPHTAAVLATRIPEFGSARNPCDVTAQVIGDPDSLRACAGALLADPAYGALVVPVVYSYAPSAARIPLLADLARAAGKPVCSVWLTEYLGGPGARETEAEPHLAWFRSMERCFATLAAWYARAERRAAPAEAAGRVAPCAAAEQAAAAIAAAPDQVLSERAAKAVLALYGVPIIAERLAGEVEDAVGAAAALGYPVVLKVESVDLPHKTEAGVVRLGLRTADAVRAAHAEIMARAEGAEPPPRIAGVLVQRMAPPGVELIVGGRMDPQFGPLVVFGLGGVLTELLRDTAVLPAPATRAQVAAALCRLRGAPLLAGFRGGVGADLDAAADAIARISELLADQAERVAELDANPLICGPEGAVAVDALIVRRGSESDSNLMCHL